MKEHLFRWFYIFQLTQAKRKSPKLNFDVIRDGAIDQFIKSTISKSTYFLYRLSQAYYKSDIDFLFIHVFIRIINLLAKNIRSPQSSRTEDSVKRLWNVKRDWSWSRTSQHNCSLSITIFKWFYNNYRYHVWNRLWSARFNRPLLQHINLSTFLKLRDILICFCFCLIKYVNIFSVYIKI